MISIIRFILFLFLMVSCGSSDQQDTATQLSVEVEERRPPLAASELFSSTDIVALDANDKSLIAGVVIMFRPKWCAVAILEDYDI